MDKIRGIFFLTVGIILLASVFVVRETDNWFHHPEKIRDRFEKEFNRNEELTSGLLNEISEHISKNDPRNLDSLIDARQDHETCDFISVLIYHNDSLLFWNDNSIPLPSGYPEQKTAGINMVRLANGWYQQFCALSTDHCVICLLPVKHEYKFRNDYLKDHFALRTYINPDVEISTEQGKYNIHSLDGKFMFSLGLKDIPVKAVPDGVLLTLFLLSFVFFLTGLYHLHRWIGQSYRQKNWIIAAFCADALIIRGALLFFSWPSLIYETELFKPGIYYFSPLFPSFGDLLLNTILIVFCAVIIYRETRNPSPRTSATRFRFLRSTFHLALVVLGALALFCLVSSLVTHSTIPMDLRNISALNSLSLLSFLIIAALLTAYFNLLLVLKQGNPKLIRLPGSKPWFSGFYGILLYIVIATLLLTLQLNISNDASERERRTLLAMKLASRRNPITEDMLSQTIERISKDTMINDRGSSRSISVYTDETLLAEYLVKNYFADEWNNFTVQATICSPGKTLRIQPQGYEEECSSYFASLVTNFGRETPSKGLWFLDYGYGSENYIAVVKAPDSLHNIFIEISSKLVFRELGYPELLIDKENEDLPEITGYSYGFYKDGELIQRVGRYAYGFDLDHYAPGKGVQHFFRFDGYDHLFYPIEGGGALLLGKPQNTVLTTISPFSYLFILFSFLAFGIYAITNPRRLWRFTINSLRTRLQASVLGSILISFLILGAILMSFLIRLNNEKDKENLLEQALSILVEMQHKFGTRTDLREISTSDLENMLIKFSNVFFSDINIYSPDGLLIGSSRPQIFETGLLSDRMNREAYIHMQHGQSSSFVQRESIGQHNYFSAYLPMLNNRNELVAFINLPYFSRQEDLKQEISAFLVTFVNIYVIFLLMGVFIAFLISGYITAPLRMLAHKISTMKLGSTNEKIEWRRQDEIGELVEEYNRKLDELAENVKRLAETEREYAWREMARQVAHEIKNPLTPMKLSVQYLQKAWEEKSPDWDSRLKRFSEALIEQIEVLSSIAAEFSDFAKMPSPVLEKVNLDDLLRGALTFYQDLAHVNVTYSAPSKELFVYADRKQMFRVFTNLLNNSVQAIDKDKGGEIKVEVVPTGGEFHVMISDSGSGISEEQANRIFQPNFTTKSGGMGLGLAIVKEIMRSQGGTITFVSAKGEGTTFTVILPCYTEEPVK